MGAQFRLTSPMFMSRMHVLVMFPMPSEVPVPHVPKLHYRLASLVLGPTSPPGYSRFRRDRPETGVVEAARPDLGHAVAPVRLPLGRGRWPVGLLSGSQGAPSPCALPARAKNLA